MAKKDSVIRQAAEASSKSALDWHHKYLELLSERAECLRVLKDAKGEIDNINRVASSEFEAQQQIKLIARIASLIKRLEGE